MPKASELRELQDDELLNRLSDSRQELFGLRFKHATGALENPARLGAVRKEIARLETLIRQREIAAYEEGSGK